MEHLSLTHIRSRDLGGGIVEITLDRPPVNALQVADYDRLSDAITTAWRGGASCILLGAAGHLFCAGGDLKERVANSHAPDLGPPLGMMRALRECPVPLVTRAQGAAAGVGTSIALSGDLVVASRNASFVMPEIDTGAIGGFRSIADPLPLPLARFMAFTGRHVSASELHRAGLIARLAEPAALDAEAQAVARQVAERRSMVGDVRAMRPRLAYW